MSIESGTSSDLVIGSMFAGRYRVERRIAAGGMGAVYEVLHVETNRRRALKVMHAHYVSSDELRARFRQEARVVAEIESEYIVDVFDAGVDQKTAMPFLVMELLRGEELGTLVKRVGALPKDDVIRYLYETSLGLDKTHRARIVHRDLKPDNLFLCERGYGPPRVKVLDFGIAKIVKDAETQANATQSLGTPLYMAPEQFLLDSAVTPATDIFALGMIAFTLLVGKPYWHAETKMATAMLAFALHVAKGPRESAVRRAWAHHDVELPKAFDDWFFRATAREPAARFATAIEAITALAEVLDVALPNMGVGATNDLFMRTQPGLGVIHAEGDRMPQMFSSMLEPSVEPATLLLPSSGQSSPPTGPTLLAMVPNGERNANDRRTRTFVGIGFVGTLVLAGGLFLVLVPSAERSDQRLRAVTSTAVKLAASSMATIEPASSVSTAVIAMGEAPVASASVQTTVGSGGRRTNSTRRLGKPTSLPPFNTATKPSPKQKGASLPWTGD